MCYLVAWNQETRSWGKLLSKTPKVGVLAHAIVCTRNQNISQQPQTSSFEDELNLPVYKLGIECECSCKDCLEILQSFRGN